MPRTQTSARGKRMANLLPWFAPASVFTTDHPHPVPHALAAKSASWQWFQVNHHSLQNRHSFSQVSLQPFAEIVSLLNRQLGPEGAV
jgi:hypothetical protein